MSGTKATVASVFDRLQSRDKVIRPAFSGPAHACKSQACLAISSLSEQANSHSSQRASLRSSGGIQHPGCDSDAEPFVGSSIGAISTWPEMSRMHRGPI